MFRNFRSCPVQPLCCALAMGAVLQLIVRGVEAGSFVAPPELENVEANAHFAEGNAPGVRFQEVHSAFEFTQMNSSPAVLTQMAYRPDKNISSPLTSVFHDFELRISTTDRGAGSLSSRFDDNFGDDATVVYSGELTMSTQGAGSSTGPRPFDYIIEFQQPFVYDPSVGNLLIDWRASSIAPGPYIDSQRYYDGSTRVLFALSRSATYADVTFDANNPLKFSVLSCDFDYDGLCNLTDIDQMYGAGDLSIGLRVPPAESAFDLNRDDAVDLVDAHRWLADAATENGFGLPYLKGDTNIDGSVDATDLNALALNWRQDVSLWSEGDFTADGVVDSNDLNQLALNWRGFIPFTGAVPIKVGSDAYKQTFDEALGTDGATTGSKLPAGWTVTDNGFVGDATMRSFPIGFTMPGAGRTMATFNAGEENDPDRALAVGVVGSEDDLSLQLLTHVAVMNADSFRLQFDVEAWDATDGVRIGDRVLAAPDDPGEAAFKVTVDVDSGDGFVSLADLGTVTTGPTLQPEFEGIVDGNADANRILFDSGVVSAHIPAGSKLRLRWAPDFDAQTNGWVFGIDNVSLHLFAGGASATPAAVPEPSALLLAILGCIVVWRRARRS